MEVSEVEAHIMLNLTQIAWGEGLGHEGDFALMRRIVESYPDLPLPYTIKSELGLPNDGIDYWCGPARQCPYVKQA